MDQQGESSVSDSLAIEMAPLARELSGKLRTLNSIQAQPENGSRPRIIIAKVRDLTRNVCHNEYDPDHVSIGPYSYPRPESTSAHLAMQHDKLTSLRAVISAAEPSRTMEVYVNGLASLEVEARSWYENSFSDLTKDQFVRMLLLDGCYIIDRFVDGLRAQPTTNAAAAADGSSTASGAAALEALAVVRDVFYLAENQIPFFVLEKIGGLTLSDGSARVSSGIAERALDLMKRQNYSKAAPAMVPPQPAGNLLHLLHMHLQPAVLSPGATRSGDADQSVSSVGRWRTATDYSFAGVKFKRRAMAETGSVRCILDVKLDSGTLEVPFLDIDNETWRLLRNLMELEQRNRETVGSHVTAYCVFMSQLACTPRDVELLSKRRVIEHAHGNDDEVAQCFADLCKGIVFDTSDPAINYLWDIRQELDRRFRSYPRRWMAWLRRKYFSNPWLTIGLLAAAIGLVCAVVQAVYSGLGYKQGRN